MRRALYLLLLVGAVVAVVLGSRSVSALPDYTAKTGQACTVCHVPPGTGGPLTDKGKAFQSIPEHIADPAGTWAKVAAPPAPPPAAPAKPAAPPAPPAPPAKPAVPAPALPKAGGFPLGASGMAILGLAMLGVGVAIKRLRP